MRAGSTGGSNEILRTGWGLISDMHPKLINGKVWVPDSVFGAYRQLPENDPKYMEILLWIDSQRFVELLDWIYDREKPGRK
jgi:hypothetical protein